MNKVILVGNVGADASTFTMKNGKNRTSFPLATSVRYKDKEGNLLEQTSWHRVSIASDAADRAARMVKKGMAVHVEGSIRYYTYTNKEGVEVNATEINCNNFQIASFPKRKDGEEGSEEGHEGSSSEESA
ncbi:hypothetical protein H4217_006950 [Coemansia sp. RSA 1939]|nr:hypothetical protein H4217_006950 [Coemansia sp. RSA 1939]KAJ2616982.1 hypothetical protein EV177_000783 [Coemansia sp. RSA 1804]KAJ2691834.1 hypothetical protein GGH99_002133 [Coemansia sp. RSA 1285]